ncbi:MAG: MBL fold metallo-hydrolase [Clostridiaceae bacterium]
MNEPILQQDLFRLEEHPYGFCRIIDPLGVGGTLIRGNERALLIDTGFGLWDIRPAVRRATDLPLIVMNSHVHTDHSGGNYQFDTVYVPEEEMDKLFDGSLDRERDSLFQSWRQVRPHLKKYMTEGVELTEKIKQTRHLPLPERFELGGRAVEIIRLGGHTRASSVVIDPSTRTAFVGDAIGPTFWLFLHPTGTIAEYAARLDSFSKRTDIDRLQLSHKSAPIPFAFVAFFREFVLRASIEKAEIWPNNRFEGIVYRYTEHNTPYGDIELYFCETNL